jgi:glycerophosphoryl diester phosphodiesterase
MPFDGDYTQEKYAAQMLDAYKAAGIPASDMFAKALASPTSCSG